MGEEINIGEYIGDPKLQEYLKLDLESWVKKHEVGRWKRTPENSFLESGNFNTNFFLDEFLKIISKQSKLPKGQRDCIVAHVGEAMHNLYLHNLKLEAENGHKEESRG